MAKARKVLAVVTAASILFSLPSVLAAEPGVTYTSPSGRPGGSGDAGGMTGGTVENPSTGDLKSGVAFAAMTAATGGILAALGWKRKK